MFGDHQCDLVQWWWVDIEFEKTFFGWLASRTMAWKKSAPPLSLVQQRHQQSESQVLDRVGESQYEV